jgi:hypothetical protein
MPTNLVTTWTQIITFIIEVCADNLIIRSFDKAIYTKKRTSFRKAMQKHCNRIFDMYADTSLDCNDFYTYIHSNQFRDFLFSFYNLSYDGKSTKTLIDFYVKDAHEAASECNMLELRGFFKSFDELYRDFLHKIVSEDVTLSAFWSLVSLNNREFYKKIHESEDSLKRYMDSYYTPKLIGDSPDLKKYHEICVKEFSKICFSGIAGAETNASKSIEDLYVENQFLIDYDSLASKLDQISLPKNEKQSYHQDYHYYVINASELFRFSNRIVLVGGAGYGKTTTANYLFCKYKELFGHDILRIKINLKDYANQIGDKEILDCLVEEVKKRTTFSKSRKIKSTVAEYLENGNAMIIFDALDEIPNESLRENARLEISRFVEVYYLNKYIITTREVGYLRNKFEDNFLHVRICTFDDNQIKEYAERWYSLRQSEEGADSKFQDFYKHFKEEARRSKCFEIIRNPIILVLALIIFDAENNLPHKRVEFYKKCIDTFLNTREERKNAFEFTEKAKCILGDNSIIPKVAYYRYNELKNDKEYKFSKTELTNSIINALEITDKRSWNDAVNIFTKYLIERTELIREMDEDIFDFSHKTFGEYFLACYFANNLEISELVDLIKEWIGDSNKDELAKLVIEVVIQQNQAQQHAAIINMLFEELKVSCISYTKKSNRNESEIIREKMMDFSRILFNIVNSGMLIPKFTDSFYALLIDYPRLLNRMPNDSSGKHIRITSPCPIDFEHYINLGSEKYSSDRDIIKLIHRYYYSCRTQMPDRDKTDNVSDTFIKKHELSFLSPFLRLVYLVICNEDTWPNRHDLEIPSFIELLSVFNETTELFTSPEAFLSILLQYAIILKTSN